MMEIVHKAMAGLKQKKPVNQLHGLFSSLRLGYIPKPELNQYFTLQPYGRVVEISTASPDSTLSRAS